MTRKFAGISLALSLLFAGCGAKPPAPAVPAAPAPAESTGEVPPPPPPPNAEPQPESPDEASKLDSAGALASLNMMVSDFNMSRGRLPTGLDELVTLKLLPAVPEAPAGKKFIIDPKLRQVVLVNR